MWCVSGGRHFQSWGAKWLKARLPVVLRRSRGAVRRVEEEDLSERDGVVIWRRSDRWGGRVMDSLKYIQKHLVFYDWDLLEEDGEGKLWRSDALLVMIRAAELWTGWSLWRDLWEEPSEGSDSQYGRWQGWEWGQGRHVQWETAGDVA